MSTDTDSGQNSRRQPDLNPGSQAGEASPPREATDSGVVPSRGDHRDVSDSQARAEAYAQRWWDSPANKGGSMKLHVADAHEAGQHDARQLLYADRTPTPEHVNALSKLLMSTDRCTAEQEGRRIGTQEAIKRAGNAGATKHILGEIAREYDVIANEAMSTDTNSRKRAEEKLNYALMVGRATADNENYSIPDARLTVGEARALLDGQREA